MSQKHLNQYFTPTWAAEMLLQRHFPALTQRDTVLDPSCGDGRLLMAVPEHVNAFGVEIDIDQAIAATSNSGRDVIVGDFTEVQIDEKPTAIFGNPPFVLKTFEDFLARCHDLLEYDRKAGFILPVYFLQTANTVMKMNKHWSIAQELLPRNIFQNLEKPLCFATFTKERKTVLSGFFLYAERAALESLKKEFRELFVGNKSKASVWRETVYAALKMNGGKASLEELYATIENNRPTDTKFWREKIRQIAARDHQRIEPGVFALAA